MNPSARACLSMSLLPIVLMSASAHAAAKPGDLEAELVRLTQELMDAIPAGNADVWRRILTDDAMLVDEFGRREGKAGIVGGIHPFQAGLSGRIEIRQPELRRYGDTAVLDGEFLERETVFGQKLVVRYIFSNTFVRDGGNWKLAASTDVTLPTAPPALAVADLHLDDYPGSYRYGPGRAFTVAAEAGRLFYTTRAGGPRTVLDPVARDVFMSGGDERNLLVFRRDAAGRVDELIERRKFNDLRMARDAAAAAQ